MSRDMLDAIAADVQSLYRRDGLVVPAVVALDSELSSSTPRLHIFEATIGEIALRGDAGPYVDAIMDRASGLQSGPISRSHLQKFLRELNDLPGLETKARFEPRATAPNEMTLVLEVRYEALVATVSINNRGTAELGRTLIAGRLTANGVLGSALSIVAATTNEPDRYRYVGASAERVLGPTQSRLDVYDSRASFTNGYDYRAQRARLEVRANAFASETVTIQPFVALAWRDGEGSYPEDVVSRARTRAAEIGVISRQSAQRMSSYARFGFSRAVDAFGAATFVANGTPADVTFSKAIVDAAMIQSLTAQWRVRLDLEGQWSAANLPAGERFTFGGAALGRAFDPAELVGDSGGAFGVELEWLTPWHLGWLRRSSVYLQSDYGYARDNESGNDDAASLSAGVRSAFASALASLELSTPLRRPAVHRDASDVRASAQIQFSF